jgi:hypothetical protein
MNVSDSVHGIKVRKKPAISESGLSNQKINYLFNYYFTHVTSD